MSPISERQIVSLHTYSGVQMYQFASGELIDLTWTREADEVSRATVNVPSRLEYDRMPDIYPWLHWVSVWDETGQDLYWAGPVQNVEGNRDGLSLTCRDPAALYTRTRCPVTKRWDVTDPVEIAGELWDYLVELHGLNIAPMVRLNPYGEKVDYSLRADDQMLDAVFEDLVRIGLRWTVVAGMPILGPMPRVIIAALGEHDFVGKGITLKRDGSQTFNDVLLRGGDNLSRARVEMGGLNLQTSVTIDSMFGVSNVDRATKEYAKHVSRFHDTLSLPQSAVLHPDAPVDVRQLVPSSRYTLEAYGVLMQMELTGIDVSCTPEASTVSVRLAAVDDELPELITVKNQNSISGAQQQ